MTTLSQARDDMLSTLRTAWQADVSSKDLPVDWPDVPFTPPESGAWARVALRYTGGGQATLANHEGVRRYENLGTVIVQVFTPAGEGQVLSDYLANVIKDAYRGVRTTNGVVFRNVRGPFEVGTEGSWYQVNVMADFEYDEVR